MFQTYIHQRKSDGKVFYVGKGGEKRAGSAKMRNRHWHFVIEKHGHTITMCGIWPTEAEAFEHEKFLIWLYRDMGAPLVNMTDGGEGVSGLVASREARQRMSAFQKGRPTSEETKRRMSVAAVAYYTPEKRKELSAAAKGRITPVLREKLNAAKQTPEFRARMADMARARSTPEYRAKLSAAAYKRNTPEYRAKLSAALTGKQRSAESCAKQSATRQTNAKKETYV